MKLAKDFFPFCSDNFKVTYWITGNHEYYHSDLNERTSEFTEEVMKNVFLVNNFSLDKEGFRIVFSTLWTKISPESTIHSWIFGHHHRNVSEFKIGGSHLLTNQLGYIQYAEQKGFRNDAFIEV